MNIIYKFNDYGLTLQNWLSPEECKKLIKALSKDKNKYHHLIIASEFKYDYYYVDGTFVFRRKRNV